MSTPVLSIGIPSKGRLQENAFAFFRRAGLPIVQPRGARDYRGTVEGLDGVEVAFLSASEIVGELARGAVHLGVTGADLIHETLPDPADKVAFLSPLGFGHANVVVAVPEAWIDVHEIADIEEVAADFRPQADTAAAGCHQIRQPHPPLFQEARHRGLPHRREPRGDRGRTGGRHGGYRRRYHHDRLHAGRQCAQGSRWRHDAEIRGASRRRALNANVVRGGAASLPASGASAHPRRRGSPRPGASCEPIFSDAGDSPSPDAAPLIVADGAEILT